MEGLVRPGRWTMRNSNILVIHDNEDYKTLFNEHPANETHLFMMNCYYLYDPDGNSVIGRDYDLMEIELPGKNL